MADKKQLDKAKRQKRDEFYTQLVDIERELRHYKPHFKNRTVYCNCDDPYESHFFKYFASNFNHLGLKRLIATSYAGSQIAGEQLSFSDIVGLEAEKLHTHPYLVDIRSVSDLDGDGAVGLSDVEMLLRNDANVATLLEGDGDFRSDECLAFLKQADIVVTNPPFSLFREYVQLLIEHEKKFLIIGHQNAISYKEVFPLIKDGCMWLGYGFKGGAAHFRAPKYKNYATATDRREGLIRVSGVVWFTNLDHNKRHEELPLYKRYTPQEYPKYDNYDGINVSKTKEIPEEYYGDMGVPITFLDKYNPDQFEIVRFRKGDDGRDLSVGGKQPYFRIIIRRRKQP